MTVDKPIGYDYNIDTYLLFVQIKKYLKKGTKYYGY